MTKHSVADQRASAMFLPFQFFAQNTASKALDASILSPFEKFWESQKSMLGEYEKLAAATLDRRRAGTEAALDTLHKMQRCTSPAEWAGCYGEWLAGSAARLADDSADILNESVKVWGEVTRIFNAGFFTTQTPQPEEGGERRKDRSQSGTS